MPEPALNYAVGDGFMMAVFGGIGALLASRRPGNPIGWLLLTTPLAFGVLLFAERLAWHLLLADGEVGGRVAAWFWVADWMWVPAVIPLFVFVPLLFPSGIAHSPRLLRAALVVWPVFLICVALADGPLQNYPGVERPVGVLPAALENMVFPLVGLLALASVGSLTLRFRHTRGVERLQILWVAAGGAALVAGFVASALLDPVAPVVASNVLVAGLLAIPAAIAVAILRYRLYDIAVVVNRTLVYGSLTAALALIYLASALALQVVLAPRTEDSGLAVAVSTLAVAGLFGPVRRPSRRRSTGASTGASTTRR